MHGITSSCHAGGECLRAPVDETDTRKGRPHLSNALTNELLATAIGVEECSLIDTREDEVRYLAAGGSHGSQGSEGVAGSLGHNGGTEWVKEHREGPAPVITGTKHDGAFEERGLLADDEVLNVTNVAGLAAIVYDNDVDAGANFANADMYGTSGVVDVHAVEGLINHDENHGLGHFGQGVNGLFDLERHDEATVVLKTGRQRLQSITQRHFRITTLRSTNHEGFLSFPPRDDCSSST